MSGGRWWQKASRQNWLPSTAWARTLEESFAAYRTLESILFKPNNFWSDGFDSCLMFTFFAFNIVWKKLAVVLKWQLFQFWKDTQNSFNLRIILYFFSVVFVVRVEKILNRFWRNSRCVEEAARSVLTSGFLSKLCNRSFDFGRCTVWLYLYCWTVRRL